MAKPKLIVFDLDNTLWPFWVDTNVTKPIRKDENNHIVDGLGEKLEPYKDAPVILEKLTTNGYTLGAASRSAWPEGSRQLLELYDWNKYFTYQEIYPGRKTTHFRKMHEASGIEYSDMLFLDDEMRNISDIRAIGVTSVLVRNGIDEKRMEEALNSFQTNIVI